MKRIWIFATFAIAAGSAAPVYAGRDGADLMLQEKARKAVIAERMEVADLRRRCAAAPGCEAKSASTAAAPAPAAATSPDTPPAGDKK